MNSTHKVEVCRLNKIGKHPFADTLQISQIYKYTVIFKEGQYKEGDLVAFVPPDSIMPLDDPQYEWLGAKRLVRAKKIRGIPSFGLVLKAPEGAQEGDDVAAQLGVKHYEPNPEDFEGGKDDNAPKKYAPVYDLETIKKYAGLFQEGELINCNEKLHGCNLRVTFDSENQVLKVGSHYRWKEKTDRDEFWKTISFHPEVEKFCKENVDCILYGESIGGVKGFDYGVPKDERRLAVFDIMRSGQWMDYKDARALTDPYGIQWCPEVLTNHPFNLDELNELAEQNTRVPGAKGISEGLVIFPIHERVDYRGNRVKLKLVSCNYLESKH